MRRMKNDVSWHEISKSVKLIDLKGKRDQEIARFGHWTGSIMERNAFVSRFARNSGVAIPVCRLRSFYSVTNEGVIFQASASLRMRAFRCIHRIVWNARIVSKDTYLS